MVNTQYSEKIDRIIYSTVTDDFSPEDWFALADACVDQGEAALWDEKEVRDETPAKAS